MIEINASPHRLDLDWIHARRAAKHGVMISINPDAHSTIGLTDLDYGIGVARKAGLISKQIFNALPYDEVCKMLKNRRN
jgi:DNA polymerase (family 10)